VGPGPAAHHFVVAGGFPEVQVEQNVSVEHVVVSVLSVPAKSFRVFKKHMLQLRTIVADFCVDYVLAGHLHDWLVWTDILQRKHSGVPTLAFAEKDRVLNLRVLNALPLAPLLEASKSFFIFFWRIFSKPSFIEFI
jgi:hypothetical protein